MSQGPFRDGKIYINAEKCETCIFRPGNLMRLSPGRVASMKAEADSRGTCIVCHDTMSTSEATVCRGYYDIHNSQVLQVAERMGFIQEQGESKQ